MTTPRIEDLVDISKYRYVWPYAGNIVLTSMGEVHIPRGMLADGATGVPDRCPVAWFAHDRLYVRPVVTLPLLGVERRLTKREVDSIYRELLSRNGHAILGLIREAGLQWFPVTSHISRSMWERARAAEAADPEGWVLAHQVPASRNWHFPSIYTRDAVWIGDCAA